MIQPSILSIYEKENLFVLLLVVASCQLPTVKQPAIKDSATAPAKTANDALAASIQAKEQASVNQKETTDSLGGLVTTFHFK